jgi:hypothetical protein
MPPVSPPANGSEDIVRAKSILAVLISASAASVAIGATASAQPPAEMNQGCVPEQGWIAMEVGVGEADRRVPKDVDEAGNQDGIVCARALGDGRFHTYEGRPDVVYLWTDNTLPIPTE